LNPILHGELRMGAGAARAGYCASPASTAIPRRRSARKTRSSIVRRGPRRAPGAVIRFELRHERVDRAKGASRRGVRALTGCRRCPLPRAREMYGAADRES
jgi:hypothetical protein